MLRNVAITISFLITLCSSSLAFHGNPYISVGGGGGGGAPGGGNPTGPSYGGYSPEQIRQLNARRQAESDRKAVEERAKKKAEEERSKAKAERDAREAKSRQVVDGYRSAMREVKTNVPINPCNECMDWSCNQAFARVQARIAFPRVHTCKCDDAYCIKSALSELEQTILAGQPPHRSPPLVVRTPPPVVTPSTPIVLTSRPPIPTVLTSTTPSSTPIVVTQVVPSSTPVLTGSTVETDRRAELRAAGGVMLTDIRRINTESREILSRPRVTVQLERAASAYITSQLDAAENTANSSIDMVRMGSNESTIRLIRDYAMDTSRSIHSFLTGVASGAYATAEHTLMGTAQVARIIWNDPRMIERLASNFLIRIGNGDLLREAGDSIHEFQITMAYGTAEERGVAIGNLATQVMIIAATGELGGTTESISTRIIEGGAETALGTRLIEGARASETLGPQIDATQRLINAGTAAIEREPTLLPTVQEIRTGYNLEISTSLGSSYTDMTAAGRSPEYIARHLAGLRREIGVRYKDMTPEPFRTSIHSRNMELYQDPLGPTVEFMRARGDSWEDIIESSMRTNIRTNRSVER